MTESTARRGAPRRRRSRPHSSSQPYDGGHVNTSNLTSINALPPVEAPTGFADLGVPPRIDDGLAACGFAQPFNIQTEAIPVAITGKDVCGRAKTGSGKTLAFGVPMLARITDEAAAVAPARTRAGADPRARRAGRRGPRAGRPPRRHARAAGLRRRLPSPPGRRTGQGRRDRRRHAAAADRSHQVERGVARRHADRRRSTRPTGWPTTGSPRRSSGSCGTAAAATRRCCSRPRSTATSAT